MKFFLKKVLVAIVSVIMITVIAVPVFAATPTPNFSSDKYVDLVPFMKEEKYRHRIQDFICIENNSSLLFLRILKRYLSYICMISSVGD